MHFDGTTWGSQTNTLPITPHSKLSASTWVDSSGYRNVTLYFQNDEFPLGSTDMCIFQTLIPSLLWRCQLLVSRVVIQAANNEVLAYRGRSRSNITNLQSFDPFHLARLIFSTALRHSHSSIHRFFYMRFSLTPHR